MAKGRGEGRLGKEGKGGECTDREEERRGREGSARNGRRRGEERRGEGIINNMFVWVQATTARGGGGGHTI